MSPQVLSFVIPAFNEAENIPRLLPRVLAQAPHAQKLQIIFVDDHSSDETFAAVKREGEKDPRVQIVRLARNSGSHMALLCGLNYAEGDAVILLAADGQDPPEFTPRLLEEWRNGGQIVWAVREEREGETLATRLFARLYYATMNRWSSVRLPPAGADFFLLDRRVVDAILDLPERNTSLLALITWLGFRQVSVSYVKERRMAGRSKWTLRKKIRLALDSLFGFSTLPLKLATGMGFVFAGTGFLYAFSLIANKVTGGLLFGDAPVEGWSATMVVLLVSTGMLMLMIGVLGEYVWRALEEVRARPRFAIEDSVNVPIAAPKDRDSATRRAS